MTTPFLFAALGSLLSFGVCLYPFSKRLTFFLSFFMTSAILFVFWCVGSVPEFYAWDQKQKLIQDIAKKLDSSPDEQQAVLKALSDDLKKKLLSKPDDFPGHMLLAKLYSMQNDPVHAVEIYHHFFKAHQDNVELLLRYAQSLYERDHEFSSISETLIHQAKVLAPDDLNVLALSALLALQKKDHEQAMADWTQMASKTSDPVLRENLLRQVEKMKLRNLKK